MLHLYNLNPKEKKEKKEKKEVSFKPFIVNDAQPREWKFWEEGKCGCPNQQKWFDAVVEHMCIKI